MRIGIAFTNAEGKKDHLSIAEFQSVRYGPGHMSYAMGQKEVFIDGVVRSIYQLKGRYSDEQIADFINRSRDFVQRTRKAYKIPGEMQGGSRWTHFDLEMARKPMSARDVAKLIGRTTAAVEAKRLELSKKKAA